MPPEQGGRPLRRLLRRTLDQGLALTTLRHGRRGLSILMYHRVLPTTDPRSAAEEPGMQVTPETFAHHLAWLAPRTQLVHLDEWLRAMANNQPLPTHAAAITFDDGWADNHDFAWPVLREAKAPATVFLVSAMLGTRQRFWPNLLATALGAATTDQRRSELATAVPVDLDGTADQVIHRAKALPDADNQARLARLLDSWGLDADTGPDLLTWDQARAMAEDDLVRFGSHTRHHQRMVDGLQPERLHDELVGSREEIGDHLGRAPELFCYPNGDVSAAALDLVRNTYSAAVTTRTGINRANGDPHQLHRIGVHEDVSNTRSGFLARLSALR